MVVFDNHGIRADKLAVEKMFEFKEKHWKPHITIHGGDNFDFAPLRKKASEEERRESMIDDFNAGVNFLKRYEPKYFLLGNHDMRLWDLAKEDRGVISDYAYQASREIEAELSKMKCKFFPYNKREGVLRLGHLKIIHGYLAGVTAARRTAQIYGSTLMGHGHAIQQASIEGLSQRTGMMCGCLCQLNMDYVRASVGSLIWEHGFAFGLINEKTGNYHVFQARKIDGHWIIPTDFVTL
jgi:hypothetical protein